LQHLGLSGEMEMPVQQDTKVFWSFFSKKDCFLPKTS
jgi:hypothetical protein